MSLEGPDYPAPAKLNLFLHVLGRRADGYHRLQSVLTLVDLHDRLRIRVRPDGLIARVGTVEGIPEDDDLAIRAARLLKVQTGSAGGADIELEKRIPVGGGLGGGSSDAATVLLVLDRLWGTGLGAERLRDLGLRLGSDVPFFLFGRSAWVEGVGENLACIEVPELWYVILTPGVAVPTREIFAAPELTRNTEPLKIQDFSPQPGGGSVPGGREFRNDLQPVVLARYPEVRRQLEWLSNHGPARLTGSGGCVFAGFQTRGEAEAVVRSLPASMKGFVARGIARHPLVGG